jgi:hypothetical protein
VDFRDKGAQTQLANIETACGRPLTELKELVVGYGPLKHAERRDRLQADFGLSFVHADTLLLWVEAETAGVPVGDPLDEIYRGAKAALRPVHDAFVARLADWGPYELVPKKGYVSLRLRKQFCMIGPATNTRMALGLNAKGLTPDGWLRALPAGKLCPFEVSLTGPEEIDDTLMTWVRAAWDQAL